MKSTLTFLALFLATAAFAQSNVAPTTPSNADSTQPSTNDTVPQFPGGPKGWQLYLQRNMHADVASDIVLRKKQRDSVEYVIVSFLVDTSGSISDVKVDNPGKLTPSVAAEAVRVITRGPNWIPATVNGVKVAYRQKQSLAFSIRE